MTTGTHVREPSAATVKEVRGWASATLPRTIATAAVTVGVLDGVAAALFSPISAPRVFQYVASGLLGARSFEGGPTTVALGIALHLLVATAVASVYVLASRHLPLLLRRPVLCGLGYGAAVYFFMRHVVVPLSAISPRRSRSRRCCAGSPSTSSAWVSR